jgi:hypothetical protein
VVDRQGRKRLTQVWVIGALHELSSVERRQYAYHTEISSAAGPGARACMRHEWEKNFLLAVPGCMQAARIGLRTVTVGVGIVAVDAKRGKVNKSMDSKT